MDDNIVSFDPHKTRFNFARNRQQFLDEAKRVLELEDYELLLCAIMDPEYIEKNPEEYWLGYTVSEYFELP
jgi:hypothetical protein